MHFADRVPKGMWWYTTYNYISSFLSIRYFHSTSHITHACLHTRMFEVPITLAASVYKYSTSTKHPVYTDYNYLLWAVNLHISKLQLKHTKYYYYIVRHLSPIGSLYSRALM